MFRTILVPADLAHADKLERALEAAASLAKQHGSRLILVGVSAALPSSLSHNPAEFAERLNEFAARQSDKHGVTFEAKAVTSHDPTRDLDQTLSEQVHETGADLVVMSSHVPGFAEHVFSSRAGYLATHSEVSVFVVR
ncbi:nucleotide-binding universal stress UspA family protein [Rhodopseudomonas julia]|uniref:Nucleotide-binding universal stress UspA family protein n=1 Tax=Rhodopseudomonas julia TaxID=200617 RepID=A0ABU0C7Z6_9BRAD|nr:universal stress protein [Rhodopseudomonas julia]MDQ0326046.1 nucleotide-binding universal stress UspA family protein [Rhodopseudomonas julia]